MKQPTTDDAFIEEIDGDEVDERFIAKNYISKEQQAAEEEDRASRKRKRMFCFECNRQEGHFISEGNRFVFSFLVGLTFGLIYVIGPYNCQCCGAQRLWRFDSFNPAFWWLNMRGRTGVGRSKKKRSQR
ncbi:MAG: hypothetical protein AAFN77_11155 [Planctomycetota bacterium]